VLWRFSITSHETTTTAALMAHGQPRSTTSIGELYDVPITPRHPKHEHSCVIAQDQPQDLQCKDVSVVRCDTSAYQYFIFGSKRMVIMIFALLLFSWSFIWLYVGANWNPQVRKTQRG
jgi:hypothetical protein